MAFQLNTRGRGETPAQQALRLVSTAANQIQNFEERQKFLSDFGYSETNTRGGKNIVSGTGLFGLGGGSGDASAARIVKAFESQPKTTSPALPFKGTLGGPTYSVPKLYEAIGETPKQEAERKREEARLEAERPFRELAAAEESLRQQQAAYQAQLKEESRLKAQYAAELQATEAKARIAGKRSAATSARVRSQAQLEATQVQQQEQKTALQAQKMQRTERTAGATVGQPGRSRTRVSTGLAIGGYGGSAASRVSPTGLNI